MCAQRSSKPCRHWRQYLLLCGLLGAACANAAEDGGEASVMLHSTITGNQEQPKVLYIVPWQPPGGVDRLQQPVQSLLGDVFAPIDRGEFRRELKYRAAAHEEQAQPTP
jgi:hypothetical protein